MTDATARTPLTASAAPPVRASALTWFDHPARISALALIAGWFAIYFTSQGQLWLGIGLALVTTAGGFLAMRRGQTLARLRRDRMQGAIEAAAARNRELELLRRLGSTLLRVRSSGELLEEAVTVAGNLLQVHGAAVLLMAEEGRFLRVAAGSGAMRPVTGSLVPAEHSLAGWCVLNDQPLISEDMEADPRNFPGQLQGVEVVDRESCLRRGKVGYWHSPDRVPLWHRYRLGRPIQHRPHIASC